MDRVLATVLATIQSGQDCTKLLEIVQHDLVPWLLTLLDAKDTLPSQSAAVVKWIQSLLFYLSSSVPSIHQFKRPWDDLSAENQSRLAGILVCLLDKLFANDSAHLVNVLLGLTDQLALLSGQAKPLAQKLVRCNLVSFLPNRLNLLRMCYPLAIDTIPCPVVEALVMDACRVLLDPTLPIQVNLSSLATLPNDQIVLGISSALIIHSSRNDAISHTVLSLMLDRLDQLNASLLLPGVMQWLWKQASLHSWSYAGVLRVTIHWICNIDSEFNSDSEVVVEACQVLAPIHSDKVARILNCVSSNSKHTLALNHVLDHDWTRDNLSLWLPLLHGPITAEAQQHVITWCEEQLQSAIQSHADGLVLTVSNLVTRLDIAPTHKMETLFASWAEGDLHKGMRVMMHLSPGHALFHRTASNLAALVSHQDAFSVVPLIKIAEDTELVKRWGEELWLACHSNLFLQSHCDAWVSLHRRLIGQVSRFVSGKCHDSRVSKFAELFHSSAPEVELRGPWILSRTSLSQSFPNHDEYVILTVRE